MEIYKVSPEGPSDLSRKMSALIYKEFPFKVEVSFARGTSLYLFNSEDELMRYADGVIGGIKAKLKPEAE